jgi:hypothetical protein
MPNRFVVPQFIEVEDKIFGPVTVRQFIIILVDFGLVFLFYKIFDFALFLITGLPLLGLGFIAAFLKINGQSFHYFLLNLLQTLRRPGLKIWDKSLTLSEVKALMTTVEEVKPPEIPVKPPLESSRLSELSLVVNTGGVYEPEEW